MFCFFNHLNYHLNDVCGSSCQALCLAFWLLNVLFQAKQLKKKPLKLTHISWPAAKENPKNKKKNKLTDTQSNPVEQKLVKMLFATEPNISLRSRQEPKILALHSPEDHKHISKWTITLSNKQLFVSRFMCQCLYCPYLYFAFHLFGAEKTQLPANSSQTKVRIVSEWGISEDIK